MSISIIDIKVLFFYDDQFEYLLIFCNIKICLEKCASKKYSYGIENNANI